MLDNIHAGLFGDAGNEYDDGSSATSSSASAATGSNTNTDTTYDDEGTTAATAYFTRENENTNYNTGNKSAPSRATRVAMTTTTTATMTKGKALRFNDAGTVYHPSMRITNHSKATPRTTNAKKYKSSATRAVSQNDDDRTVRTNYTSGAIGAKFTIGNKSTSNSLRSASNSHNGSVVTFASDERDDDDCTMSYTPPTTRRKSYFDDDDCDTATAYTTETDAGLITSSPWCMISHIFPPVVEEEENESAESSRSESAAESATTFTTASTTTTATMAASDADNWTQHTKLRNTIVLDYFHNNDNQSTAATVMHDEVDTNTNYNKSSSTKPTKKKIGVGKQMVSSLNATWIATKAKVAKITPTSTNSTTMDRPNKNLVLVSSRGKTTRAVGRSKTCAVGLVDKARRELCTC